MCWLDTVNTILKRELVGLEIRVVKSDNPSLACITGRIVDESRNTLIVYDGKKTRKLIKAQITFETVFKGKKIIIDGKNIIRKPEDRIKGKMIR
ncbi:ribonuclease P protein subunit [Candidatus Woesearchaeota archaeon]|nr:ribonuclease P protein subunit [Candidatus Woesearchaeota archaeon]